jgi:DNA polymerase-1
MATDPEIKQKVVICTIDKDLQTIPGHHYNFSKDLEFTVSEHQADLYHMSQTLTGDATDGYKGCPGMGAVGAKKLLDKVLEEATPWATAQTLRKMLWDAVVAAYAKAGLGEEEALCQARVARILRTGEFNFKTNEVNLWEPVR